MHYSTNNGISWKPMNEWPEILEVNQFAIKDSIYVAGTANHGLYMSFDYGNSWENLKNFT
jgi:hypothetical protein